MDTQHVVDTMQHNVALKGNEHQLLMYTTRWVHLKIIMLSERSPENKKKI